MTSIIRYCWNISDIEFSHHRKQRKGHGCKYFIWELIKQAQVMDRWIRESDTKKGKGPIACVNEWLPF